jgi:hypothetical protein
MSVSGAGPLLFARYAYPPNRLGLCGPDDSAAVRESAVAGAAREMRHLAEGFDGAYPYLRLIAEENGIADPLDPRVVEGYWIGNALTRRVRERSMYGDIEARFRRRMTGREWRWIERAVAAGGAPLHAFHVFEIYPRVGLMRGGDSDLLPTIDACRIRWGTLVASMGDELVVNASRLEMADGLLRLGPPTIERVHNPWPAMGPTTGPARGDAVSLHWGWACDRLSPAQVRRLEAWTAFAITNANRTSLAGGVG